MSLVLLVLAVACTSAAGGDGSSTTQQPPVATTTPGSTTVSSTAPPTAPATTTTAPTTTTTEPLTTTTVPLPPHKASLEHGGDAWVVYLAVSADSDAPELSEATQIVSELGYPSGVGDLGCDSGGHQAVGFDTGTLLSAVAVYFETAVDAARFAVALDDKDQDVAGLGLVQTLCMD